MRMSYGIIYEALCIVTNLRYVGQTVSTLKRRWSGHCRDAKMGIEWELAKAIREHGSDNFQLRIICECDSDVELNIAERKYIAEFKSVHPGGYNMTNGGEGPCELTRKLISKRTKEAMAKIDPAVREEQKQRQRQNMLGKKRSDEAKQNMSIAQKKIIANGGGRAWFSAGGRSRKDSKHREESKQLMRQNRRGKCVGDAHPMKRLENRLRASVALTGRPVMSETRKKIGIANRVLSDDQCLQVLARLREGATMKTVAIEFCVSVSTIRRIKHAKYSEVSSAYLLRR